MDWFYLVFSLIWGSLLALAIQYTAAGQWVVVRMRWVITLLVIIGDLSLLQLVTDEEGLVKWTEVLVIMAATVVPLIVQGVAALQADDRKMMRDAYNIPQQSADAYEKSLKRYSFQDRPSKGEVEGTDGEGRET